LTHAPVLGIYRSDCDIIIDVDTSSTSCGAVCSQIQDGTARVLEYASRCLSKPERNMCAYRRELTGLMFALKKFRPYLLGRKFTVKVDNLALKSLLTVKSPTGHLARQLDYLADFDFTLQHRPGKSHLNCDALSRLRPCHEGQNDEPCKQCTKLVTGEHINVVTTRRQAKLKPLFAPIFQPDVTQNVVENSDVSNSDDDSVTNDNNDYSDDDVTDNAAFSPPGVEKQGSCNNEQPAGLLGRTAPNAAANIASWTPEKLRNAQLQDPDIADALLAVEKDTRPCRRDLKSLGPALRALFLQYDSLVVVNGVLYRVFYASDDSVKHYQFILPHSLKREFLELIHADLCGHMSTHKCKPEVQRRSWWYKWQPDVELYVRSCDKCASYHRGKAPKQGLLHPMVLDEVGARWSIDLTGDFPSSHGFRYIFTAVCPFSKFLIAVPIRCKTAKVVARVIVERILLIHSLPCEILSDNGTEFCNQLSDELYRLLGINRLKTTSRKASTNGCVERLHRTLNSIIAKVVDEDNSNWSSLVPYAVFSYNATVHAATGFSPFYIMYGRQPNWNIDLLLHGKECAIQSVPRYTADVVERLRVANHIVRQKLGAQAQYMSTWYNRAVRPALFSIGDTVRVFNDTVKSGRCPKWQHFYKDVATVVARFNDVTYKVSCPSWRSDRIVHVDKLKLVQTFNE